MKLSLSVAIALLLISPLAWARPVGIFSYEQAFKQADLVVIGTATETSATDDKWNEWPNNPEYIPDFKGQDTTFKVAQILKGDHSGDQLKVLHFKYTGKFGIPNGPQLIEFRTAPMTLKGSTGAATVRPDYMLFLKLRKDGRYEPASGQVDPVLSVKEMYDPFSHHLGGTVDSSAK